VSAHPSFLHQPFSAAALQFKASSLTRSCVLMPWAG